MSKGWRMWGGGTSKVWNNVLINNICIITTLNYVSSNILSTNLSILLSIIIIPHFMCYCPRYPKTALSLHISLRKYLKDYKDFLPEGTAKHESRLCKQSKLHISQSVNHSLHLLLTSQWWLEEICRTGNWRKQWLSGLELWLVWSLALCESRIYSLWCMIKKQMKQWSKLSAQ